LAVDVNFVPRGERGEATGFAQPRNVSGHGTTTAPPWQHKHTRRSSPSVRIRCSLVCSPTNSDIERMSAAAYLSTTFWCFLEY
jgi:hypothetical protein